MKPAEIGKAPEYHISDVELKWEAGPNGSICMPSKTAGWIHTKLELLDMYPKMCQIAIDVNMDFAMRKTAMHYENREADLNAKLLEAELESDSRWSWWEVGLLAGGVGALGIITGLVIGFVAK